MHHQGLTERIVRVMSDASDSAAAGGANVDRVATRSSRPLDPEQYRLWHRLRRMPRFVFVIVLGAMLTSGAIVALNTLVTWALTGVTLGAPGLVILFVGLAVLVGLCFAWTWSYMQKRYAATAGLRCPGCGYLVIGLHSDRCPECGRPVTG